MLPHVSGDVHAVHGPYQPRHTLPVGSRPILSGNEQNDARHPFHAVNNTCYQSEVNNSDLFMRPPEVVRNSLGQRGAEK